jgi:hypothetical protein
MCERLSGPVPTYTKVYLDDGGGEEDEVPRLVATTCCLRLRAKMLLLNSVSALWEELEFLELALNLLETFGRK